jgi:hypothetical protein
MTRCHDSPIALGVNRFVRPHRFRKSFGGINGKLDLHPAIQISGFRVLNILDDGSGAVSEYWCPVFELIWIDSDRRVNNRKIACRRPSRFY